MSQFALRATSSLRVYRGKPELLARLKQTSGWNQFFEELDKDYSGTVDRAE